MTERIDVSDVEVIKKRPGGDSSKRPTDQLARVLLDLQQPARRDVRFRWRVPGGVGSRPRSCAELTLDLDPLTNQSGPDRNGADRQITGRRRGRHDVLLSRGLMVLAVLGPDAEPSPDLGGRKDDRPRTP
jgi:hypothetical protein